MVNSTKRRSKQKRTKPRPDFPLFRHATGRWAKKVRGRFCYFGKLADDLDGAAALQRSLEVKDDLLAGRPPRPTGEQLTVADLCNHFLTFKQQLLDSGELPARAFDRYHRTCGFVVAALGRTRAVDGLRPDDFQRLRGLMAKRWGPIALENEIQIVRSLFRYCFEAELTARTVRFGPGFKKPSAKTIRQTPESDAAKD
ncbi:MAG: hypothetical protein A2V98_09315 [Planctomycetes bacterium RBG_16_64_12]|nr:MAG: hypothetical protein A2V98_09315 [Planctomycetes bacterium RBG_16_64_12]